jgi:hypothetical protein
VAWRVTWRGDAIRCADELRLVHRCHVRATERPLEALRADVHAKRVLAE